MFLENIVYVESLLNSAKVSFYTVECGNEADIDPDSLE